ncbi:3-methyl-2-oxobutanoate hydroxymethyltransferase [Mumia zhuanghuii]|uniref:3-methyl-2-oxobutanoate hydroxymethyltransferase n=1 Tax=Mumia zhuanghuii TaxID=2585211 RepID=A0A5C4M3H7_9ACTN|nr:3-methyl-2-oxobutanoate hydroxymethyltransferase [Mumia zhuanghuii]TNC26008.1 3-methyl-2-oxobutanoate hydroxymethyltransferase [Mumia zhuanghuii]TNC47323.1 3-methyl-2-oxobutanoate hydroxymethyltransferase [Mumia zhuanghuii]
MSQNTSAAEGGAPQEEPAPYGTGSAPTPATAPAARRRVRTHTLQQMKERHEKWTMLTSYDQYSAQIFDEAGVQVLLVGDSAANNVYGYESSLPVSVDELLPLVRAVSRSAKYAFVLADLPFGSYQGSPEQAYDTAVRFMKDGHAHGVKLEGGAEMVPQIRRLVDGGVPVCAHIGFTPQSEHTLGGYRIQGRGDAAKKTIDDALAVQEAGAFAVVMEMVPGDVATEITSTLRIPTIGIGAGAGTDAQVLVWQDMMGLNAGRLPRFVKTYADLRTTMLDAARAYVADVEGGSFPGEEHTFQG